MKRIKLTQGKYTLIDDEDFEMVNKFKWHALKLRDKYYAGSNLKVSENPAKFKTLLLHRFIMNVTDKEIQVDHINHNGLNNQKYNLRKATFAQNRANKNSNKNSASKYVGVSKAATKGKWRAIIGKKTGNISLGTYKTEIEAALAYNEAAKIINGEFANLNKIPKHLQITPVRCRSGNKNGAYFDGNNNISNK